jgi:hypothetical protein
VTHPASLAMCRAAWAGARPPARRPAVCTERIRTRSLALLLVLALAACGREKTPSDGGGRPPDPPDSAARLGPYPRAQFFIEHDLFLSVDEPATVPAEDATFLEEDDEVLGFVVRGKARAYAVTMVSYHHVVNDVLAGIPVAVTY